VGSTTSQEADVRIIAATNRLPHQAVAMGRLREDLLYRLNVFPLDLPPLRARLEDVPLLARHFLAAISGQEGQLRRFTPAALAKLSQYAWPGNVRELRNAVQRAYVMASDELIDEAWLPGGDGSAPSVAASATPLAASLATPLATPLATSLAAPLAAQLVDAAPAGVAAAGLAAGLDGGEHITVPIGTSLAQAEKMLMLATLRHYNHHKERTAAALGVSLKTLYNRLKEYGAEAAAAAGRREAD